MYKYIYRVLAVFLFLLAAMHSSYGQDNPGGISGVTFWMDADQKYTNAFQTGNKVSIWRPRVGYGMFSITDLPKGIQANSSPTLIKGSVEMSYRDAVSFDIKDYLASKSGPGLSDPSEITIFAVYIGERTKTNELRMYYMGFGGTNPNSADSRKPAIGFSPKEGGARIFGGIQIDGKNGGYKPFTTALQTMDLRPTRPRVTGVTNFYFEGVKESMTRYISSDTYFKLNQGATIGGASLSEGTGASFSGQIGEIIVYDRILSVVERQKVEAYLASKYGITLRGVNYTMSNGVIMWMGGGIYGDDFENQPMYHNNVAGIMRDDKGLSNYVSRSTAKGTVLSVSTKGSIYEAGKGITKTVPLPTNLTSLYWGVNSSRQGRPSGSVVPDCGFNTKLADKVWMFKKAGTSDSMNVEIRAGGEYFPYQGSGYQVYINLYTNESDAQKGVNPYKIIPGKYFGGDLQEHSFDVSFDYATTYVTFTARALPGYCSSCTQSVPGQYNFKTGSWASGSSTGALVATNGMRVGVNVQANNLQNGYPSVTSGDVFTLRVNNTTNNSNQTVATFDMKDGAAKVKFNLYGIDKRGYGADDIQIIGYCGNAPINPNIEYENKNTNFKNKAYEIAGNRVVGIRSTAMKGKDGIANVEFTTPVTRVEVRYKVNYTRVRPIGTQEIGIGNFNFECARRPAPNPDGIDFALQAKSKIKSCEDLTYRFAIGNFNCGGRPADLNNVLPEGMEWVPNSLTSTDDALKDAVINNYGQTNTLDIKGIRLKAVDYVYLEAKVRLKQDAKVDITYENRASLSYVKENGGGAATVTSCDYSNSDECLPTKTFIEGGASFLKPVLSLVNNTSACYKGNSIVNLTFTISNPNPVAISKVTMKFAFNDEFTFKSLLATGGNTLPVEQYPGLVLSSGQTINANSSESYTLSFQAMDLKALVEYATGKTYASIKDIPEQDYLKVAQFDVSAELSSDADDVCLQVALEDTFANLEPILFCGKDNSCYYPAVTGNVVKKSSDFVLITSLDRSKTEMVKTESINALLYLESKSKGFVITRLSDDQIKALAKPVAGMLVYDTTNKCIKLYNGKLWSCVVQSCPDN
ncbi:hypothetical protein LNQ81_13115 [Myroides sp. M-43]|uniref:hypothetical protein n=1 Tax=Myroides oncorhynchi TaxID=2893756 RepID=UPI001E50C60D|nr:hypothetical protein [Myroides oncorhynchi]MCC9043614.1 hypothetical protein [Myroides oncorhynchi]